MATLFQLLILAQVYLYSRGETLLGCSLLPICSLLSNEPLSTCACLAKLLGGARGHGLQHLRQGLG